jgi:hypothetical protein
MGSGATVLNDDIARHLAATALENVRQPFPYHVVHLLRSADDVRPPHELHPAFWGSYDWHSCVHMHWSLARCLHVARNAIDASSIDAHFSARLTPAAIAGELAYVAAPGRASFERPYGWGWLLKLAAELASLAASEPIASAWADALAPLARHFADRFVDFLPRSDYPIRAGTHANSAFALILALDYAQAVQHRVLATTIESRAATWFGRDRRYPADYEPSGNDFLSGGLCEALLMARVLPACDFTDWWEAFAPPPASLARWLTPVAVRDATDPQIVHLHGLNLSRAWCWKALAPRLPAALRAPVAAAIEAALAASLPAATQGDFVGTHWLASFALLALAGPPREEG